MSLTFESANLDFCAYYEKIFLDIEDKKSAEISFINETKRANLNEIYQNDFIAFISILFRISFSELGFNKLTTETYGIRTNTLQILDQLGFQLKQIKEEKILIDNKLYDSFFHEYKPKMEEIQ